MSRRPTKEEYVNVRVWRAKKKNGEETTPEMIIIGEATDDEAKRGNVGHVSVETQNCYASFWPAEPVTGLKTPVPSRNNPSPRVDEIAEGGPPDTVVRLYSLDTDEIEKEFLTTQEESYALKRNPFYGEPSLNCSSSGYRLLAKGGINELSSVCAGLTKAWKTLSPHDLDACIKDAKTEEIKKYPETEQFDSPTGCTLS